MSKTGDWLLTLQEEAACMTKEDFLKKHGKHYEDIWDEINNPKDHPSPDDYIDDNKLMNGVKCITS